MASSFAIIASMSLGETPATPPGGTGAEDTETTPLAAMMGADPRARSPPAELRRSRGGCPWAGGIPAGVPFPLPTALGVLRSFMSISSPLLSSLPSFSIAPILDPAAWPPNGVEGLDRTPPSLPLEDGICTISPDDGLRLISSATPLTPLGACAMAMSSSRHCSTNTWTAPKKLQRSIGCRREWHECGNLAISGVKHSSMHPCQVSSRYGATREPISPRHIGPVERVGAVVPHDPALLPEPPSLPAEPSVGDAPLHGAHGGAMGSPVIDDQRGSIGVVCPNLGEGAEGESVLR